MIDEALSMPARHYIRWARENLAPITPEVAILALRKMVGLRSREWELWESLTTCQREALAALADVPRTVAAHDWDSIPLERRTKIYRSIVSVSLWARRVTAAKDGNRAVGAKNEG